MCGIAGFWQANQAEELPVETLGSMGSVLKHRGPDDSGLFHDPSAGLGLVHRRLSIVDLSPAGHQPMHSASGRFVILFNGEVYNSEALKTELGAGISWRGHSDTEVMVEAIERWGLDSAVGRFVGMFAFALWDRQERKLYLVRDRLGIKPIYYGRVQGDFVFASELKAIRQYPGFQAQIDRGALALYMRYNYVPSPHCIYEGLSKLKPGCILELGSAHGEPSLRPYWSAADVAKQGLNSPITGSDAEVIEQLERQLAEAVNLRMIADVPLGAFLSGGIDSSTVVALMQAQSSRPVKTFTIGFDEDDFNEAAHAQRVARHLGTDHTELYVTARDALNVVPLLPAMYDEPFSDSSQIPTYLVSKLAKSSVTVTLSGDGGDELFGGYNRYLFIRRLWNSIQAFPGPVRTILPKLVHAIAPTTIDRLWKALSPILPEMPAPGERAHKLGDFLTAKTPREMYIRALSHWQDPGSVVLDSAEPDTVVASISNLALAAGGLEQTMMLADLMHYLPDDILTKVDRASMAVSLEARVPLLDHRLVELAWKLPLNFKIRNGTSKWILRQILYKYVPPELMERPKMGFGIPIHVWLKGPLRDWAETLLSENNLRQTGFFNVAIVRAKWKEHLSGARNWQYLLWDVLAFQDWLRSTSTRALQPAIEHIVR